MKLFSLCLYISLLAGALVSCRTTRQGTNISTAMEVKVDTIVKERIVEITTPEDSARIVALLRCDSAGQVLLESYNEERTKNVRLQFSLDSMGRMQANFATECEKILITATDTLVKYVEKNAKTETEIVEVEREWTLIESYLHVCGWILNVIIILCVSVYIIKSKFL